MIRKTIKITDTIFGTNKDGDEIEINPDNYLIEFSQSIEKHHTYRDYYFILMENYLVQWLAIDWIDIKNFTITD